MKSNQNNLLDSVHETLLMGPGPSSVPPEVYRALSLPTIGHLDPAFIEIMDHIKKQLRWIINTDNRLTLPISGTGSAGMETCFVNLVEPGDDVLILINGVFGMRMKDVAGRLNAVVDTLEFDWGTPVDPEQVRDRLQKKDYRIVSVVHAETSTGVANPVSEIGHMVRETGALFLVDAVTSLGGMPVDADDWGVDAIYSGTQKCLSCPPGLAPVSFSERALEKTMQRKTKVPNWYLDLSMIVNYWEGEKRAYHHTAPVNMLYGLYQALDLILNDGPENVFRRHLDCHNMLIETCEDMGISMFVDPGARLPMLNAVVIPDGIDEATVRSRLLKDYRIEIGAGLGPLAGKIWRIGIMGHTARPENISRLADALSDLI